MWPLARCGPSQDPRSHFLIANHSKIKKGVWGSGEVRTGWLLGPLPHCNLSSPHTKEPASNACHTRRAFATQNSAHDHPQGDRLRGLFSGLPGCEPVRRCRDCSPHLTVLEESRAGASKPPASTPDPRKSSWSQGPSAHFSPSAAWECFVLSRVPGRPTLAPFSKAARGRECEGFVGRAPQEGLAASGRRNGGGFQPGPAGR